jgi:hypothetical protein
MSKPNIGHATVASYTTFTIHEGERRDYIVFRAGIKPTSKRIVHQSMHFFDKYDCYDHAHDKRSWDLIMVGDENQMVRFVALADRGNYKRGDIVRNK